MSGKIIQLRLITGEDIICEIVNNNESSLDVKNRIQIAMIPSKANPGEMTYGFMPFPNFSNPKSEKSISISWNSIVFSIKEDDVEPDFLEQYNQIFRKIVAPTGKLIV